jgi:hypothetical protein
MFQQKLKTVISGVEDFKCSDVCDVSNHKGRVVPVLN